MSLIGVLRTGVSGMNAQSNRISTVAENIQNSSTTGYKRTGTEFSSLLLDSAEYGNYNSGAVETTVRRTVTEQGPVAFTTSPTDLAIQGNGFFLVRDGNNSSYLTRSGNFVVDGGTGNLVNAGGFTLLGYALLPNGEPDTDGGLVPVQLPTTRLQAQATTTGRLTGNLPFGAAVQTAAPGTTAGTYSQKTSMVTYDNVGQEVLLDVYMTRTADDTWTLQLYDRATPPAKRGEGTVTFDANGQVKTAAPITLAATASSPEVTIDVANLTQLAADYDVKTTANGSEPKAGTGVSIGGDGTVYATYADGTRTASFRIPLADVRSPDNLQPRAGNIYETTAESGAIEIGVAAHGGRGTIKAGALEQSNVDVSTELTTMIESQSVYTANSKVFMTGNELLETLMNLKRLTRPAPESTMGLQLALNTARSSLLATSSQIATSARNVAGLSDAAYARKIATLVTGEGTARVVVSRAADAALFARKLSAASDAAASSARLEGLRTLAQTVGDAVDGASPAGRLGAFNAALQAAANQPDNADLARAAIDRARELATSLNAAAQTVQGVRGDADAGMAASVGTVNDLLGQFDAANRAVMRALSAGTDASDALDDRDRILGALAEQVGIATIERAGGDMAIYTDGGVPLFDRSARSVVFDPATATAPATVVIDGVAVTGAGTTMPLASGRIAGLAALRDGPAAHYGAQLDAIAGALVAAFSEGGGATGLTAKAGLFTVAADGSLPTGSANLAALIAVNADVDPQQGGDAALLRDGGMNGAAYRQNPAGEAAYPDRLNALTAALAAPRGLGAGTDIAATVSLADFAAASAGWLEGQRKDASATSDYQTALLARAGTALSNAAGVNGDDETALTLQLERSYTASAKILTIVDDLLKTLMDAVR